VSISLSKVIRGLNMLQELTSSNYEFVELIVRLIVDGLASSSQMVGSLLRTPWLAVSQDNDLSIAPMVSMNAQ
jgi:hypothetical protein